MNAVTAILKLEKENRQKPTYYNLTCLFSTKISQMSSIPLGVSHKWALWADIHYCVM